MRATRRLARYLRPYRAWAIAAPLSMALEVALDLAQPRLLQTLIDQGIKGGDLTLVLHLGLIMLALAILGAFAGIGCTYYAIKAAMSFGADVRDELFRKVQALSFGDLDQLETGPLVTRLTNDVDQVQQAVGMLLRIMVRAPLLVIGSLTMAIVTSPKLSLLICGIAPVLILILALFIRSAHAAFAGVQARLDRVNAIGLENLTGVRVVKAFVRGRHESKRFEVANEDFMASTIRAQVLVTGVMPLMMLMANIGVVGVLWFGGLQVNAGTMQVGQILAFVNYLTLMLGSLTMVGMLITRVVRAEASAERLDEVLQSHPEVVDRDDAQPWPEPRGAVRFDHVTFRYAGSLRDAALREVSFTAEPGELIAIVGPTGAGKSSLVNLIPRLYDVAEGAVLVDDHDVRDIRSDDLRRHVAVVLQESVLFSGTIADNLRFGRPEATDEEIEEAARMAQAHDFINGFDDGYQTQLGQRGVNLSGGQKQRLAIARALAAHPKVLILDGCTSALDAATESRLFAALRDWSHPCTRFVVSHRLGPVLAADRILVLEDGELLAMGTHAELMETCPHYREVAETQMSGRTVTHG